MLRRIREIKGVGCFVDSSSPAIQFEPLTFIFGENCYGKSTFCDILRSLSERDPNLIKKRLSIPIPRDNRQNLIFNFIPPNQEREEPYRFQDGEWNPNFPSNMPMLVFDSDFIHRNVFTGLNIERGNHESITQFVLGEGSVQKAEKIRDLNKELRATTKEIGQIKNTALARLPIPLDSFVALEINEQEQEVQQKINRVNEKIEQEKHFLRDLAVIKNRPEPSPINLVNNFEEFVDRVNTCLSSTYSVIHESAQDLIRKHIFNHTSALETAETWIFNGLSHIRENECPFCGQQFVDKAASLIAAYKAYFDKSHESYVAHIDYELTQFEEKIYEYKCDPIAATVERNLGICIQYPEI